MICCAFCHVFDQGMAFVSDVCRLSFLNKKTKCYTSPGSGVAAAAASSIGIEVHGSVGFLLDGR